MTTPHAPALRPQPMIAVTDVEASSRWYQLILGAASGHGGQEYEQLLVDGTMIMQLHLLEEGHHHGLLADPAIALGNGVALWSKPTALTWPWPAPMRQARASRGMCT